MWVAHTLKKQVCISTQGWKGAKMEWRKTHDRSGAGEEGYVAIGAGCEGGERDGT